MFIGFVITVLLGRCLGAKFGIYLMTSMIYGIAILISGIGISGTMIMYVDEFKDKG